jgi:hypothetical protein
VCVCNAELMTYAEPMYFGNYVMLNLYDIYAILCYLWYSVSVQSLCESASRPPCRFWKIDDQQLDI